MKKWGLLLLLSALLLTGCAAGENLPPAEGKAPAVSTAVAAETETAQSPDGELTAAKTEAQARSLTEEELLDAYDRAVAAYGWFDLSTLPCGDEALNVNGREYYPVTYRGMETLEDLRTYLRGVFSQEVTDRLLSGDGKVPLYQDIEGALYVLPMHRERDRAKGDLRVQTEQRSDTAYAVNVAVNLLDESDSVTAVECYAFPYELVDERWVFTEFRLVY